MIDYIQAPWLVTEDDPKNSGYILTHNYFTNKTFRLQKSLAGSPFGKDVNDMWRGFLIAEKLIVRKQDILPMLENHIFEQMYGFPSNDALVVLNPTNACQLNCVYCYNSNVRDAVGEKGRLPAGKIADKIIEYFMNTPAQIWDFSVTGGGEPTLVTDYLCAISTKIRARAKKEGREFKFGTITNAQNLTKENVRKLVKAGLTKVQVSLDPLHDQRRPMKSGKGSFDTIIKNLLALPPSIRLILTSNVMIGDEKNFKNLLKKIAPLRDRAEQFGAAYINPKIPLQPVRADAKGAVSIYNDKNLELTIRCMDIVDDAGFVRKLAFPGVHCEAFANNMTFAINFKGETTFCPSLSGMKEYAGDLFDGVLKKKFDMRESNPAWKDHCFDKTGTPCAYLPACWGGCRMISMSNGRTWDTIHCEKKMFDRLGRHELLRWAEVWTM